MNKIEKLKAEVVNGTWENNNRDSWSGAGLIISDSALSGDYSDDVVVVTKYAVEISGILKELFFECFKGYIDYYNKYEFCSRIGNALKKELLNGDNRERLIDAMFAEALCIEEEWGRVLYFAYGSNMDEAQMKYRCPNAKLVGKAYAANYKFCIDRRRVATIVPNTNTVVEGLLWSISQSDEASLDRYEGVRSGCYRKERITVALGENNYNALVYISNSDVANDTRYSEYMERIIRAAQAHQLSDDYIAELIQLNK